jgi:plasmid stability protein
MTTMTLRGIDDTLAKSLKELARNEGVSLNALVLRIIREATGSEKRKRTILHHDLDCLAGTWSAEDEEAFRSVTTTLEAVDADLWA